MSLLPDGQTVIPFDSDDTSVPKTSHKHRAQTQTDDMEATLLVDEWWCKVVGCYKLSSFASKRSYLGGFCKELKNWA